MKRYQEGFFCGIAVFRRIVRGGRGHDNTIGSGERPRVMAQVSTYTT